MEGVRVPITVLPLYVVGNKKIGGLGKEKGTGTGMPSMRRHHWSITNALWGLGGLARVQVCLSLLLVTLRSLFYALVSNLASLSPNLHTKVFSSRRRKPRRQAADDSFATSDPSQSRRRCSCCVMLCCGDVRRCEAPSGAHCHGMCCYATIERKEGKEGKEGEDVVEEQKL
ncbi:hypothetical protein BU24DRAFT_405172 [Aaosphaeria arxii CBS 175.79]|uniref:Uncharacterized protein n=1 Tax=Aaosphaeria arxii CBS 175.79 TaxID=1450172 RepID=A0A6A5YCE6_9PLEO|nr:uncharacterized protein BU24DRAFT_405172 [Aaosphaeria arxii CBS 175.79]KAF2022294.1 hypothetical protein BU24DRAFT_405172 [Aaosphaeria arxii CBS 175.79]